MIAVVVRNRSEGITDMHSKWVIMLFSSILTISSSAAEVRFIQLQAESTSIQRHESTLETTVFQTSLSGIEVQLLNREQGSFITLVIPGYHRSFKVGEPQLPCMNKLLDIGSAADIRFEIIDSEYEIVDLDALGLAHPLLPVQPSVSKGTDPATVEFIQDQSIYSQDHFYGSELVTIEEKGILREQHLVLLSINPVSYNPVANQLKIYHTIRFRLVFDDVDWEVDRLTRSRVRSPAFAPLSNIIEPVHPGLEPEVDLVTAPIKMVIVAPQIFEADLQPFVNWKTSQGFVMIEGYLGVDGLGTTSTAIQTWLYDLYSAGTVDDPAPSYVMIVGDVAQVPTFTGTTGSHPTDLFYVDMTGDELPEMYLARMSVTSNTQLQAVLDKTLMYERYEMTDPTYLAEVVLIAGVDGTFGATHGNGQINYGTNHYFNLEHGIISHTYLYPESGSSAGAIYADLNAGVSFANYTAHGGPTSWVDPALSVGQVNAMTNSEKYCLAVANACLTAKYTTGTCIGEAFLRVADGGAIGYIGGSNNTYWDEDYYWAVGFGPVIPGGATYEQTGLGAYDGLFHDHNEPGDEWYVSNAAMVYCGNLAVTESGSGFDNYYWEIYQLFGDPSLMVYCGVPDTAVVTHPDSIFQTTYEIVIQAPPHSYVGLSSQGTFVSAGETDELGSATLSIDPFSMQPGLADLVITGQNLQPYFGEILVVPEEGVTIGDVNADGFVNIQDVIRLVAIILHQGDDPTPLEMYCADMTADGLINIGDLVFMTHVILGE